MVCLICPIVSNYSSITEVIFRSKRVQYFLANVYSNLHHSDWIISMIWTAPYVIVVQIIFKCNSCEMKDSIWICWECQVKSLIGTDESFDLWIKIFASREQLPIVFKKMPKISGLENIRNQYMWGTKFDSTIRKHRITFSLLCLIFFVFDN